MTKPIFDSIAEVYDCSRNLPPEIMDMTIQTLASIINEGQLLDIGVGTGRFAVPLSASGVKVTGIDISCGMMSRCRQKGFSRMFVASAYTMPFQSKSFDHAMIIHVLHLMDDWKLALRETCRVTKGSLLSSVSRWPESDWPGDYYGMRVKELGFGHPHPGKFERELAEIIPPTETIHVGTFTRHRENDEYIDMLEARKYSSATKLPDDLHAKVIREARDRYAGGREDVPATVEVCVWDIEELSESLKIL
ncbi:MAG: class I SAM-dependent methyltransferase [Thermoplasmata archaeon]|nr:class I SAM-dependent methyltransferase [Thermoplasmata archaeon]